MRRRRASEPGAAARRAGRARLPATASPPGGPAASAPETVDEVLAASPRVTIDTPSIGGSIDLKGGKIDDIILKDYRETIDPKSPNIRLFSPPGAPDAYWAETGFVSAERRQDAQSRHRLDRRPQNADRRAAGDADLGQRRGPHLQARHRGRRQIYVHDHRFGRELRRRAGDGAALRAHPAPRQAERRRIFGAA